MAQQTRTAPCGPSRTRTAGARSTGVRHVALLLLGGLALGLLLVVLSGTGAEADDTPQAPQPTTSSPRESAEADAPPSGATAVVPASSDRSGPLSTGTSSNDSAAHDSQVPEASASAGPSSAPAAPVAEALAAITAIALPDPSASAADTTSPVRARPVAGVPNAEVGVMHHHSSAEPVVAAPPAAAPPVTVPATVPNVQAPLTALLSTVGGGLHETLAAVPVLDKVAPTIDTVVATTVDLVDTTTTATATVLRSVSVSRPIAGLHVLGIRLAPVTERVDTLLVHTGTTVAPTSPAPTGPAGPTGPVDGPRESGWPSSAAPAPTSASVPSTSAAWTGDRPSVIEVADGPTVATSAATATTVHRPEAPVAVTGGSALHPDRSGTELPVPAGHDQAVAPAGGATGGAGTAGGGNGGPVASLLASLDLPAHHGGSRMMPGAWELPGAPSYDPGHSPD